MGAWTICCAPSWGWAHDAGAPQRAQVRAATQQLAEVFAQRADVGAFAADHAQAQHWRIALQLRFDQFQSVTGIDLSIQD